MITCYNTTGRTPAIKFIGTKSIRFINIVIINLLLLAGGIIIQFFFRNPEQPFISGYPEITLPVFHETMSGNKAFPGVHWHSDEMIVIKFIKSLSIGAYPDAAI